MPPPMSKTMRRRALAAIMLQEFNKEAKWRQYLLETETSARRRITAADERRALEGPEA